MPIYEFRCMKCNKIEEFFVKSKENIEPLHFSDTCEAITMIRIVSKTSFKLEGAGWASDGYQKKSKTVQSSINELKSNLSETKEALKKSSSKMD